MNLATLTTLLYTSLFSFFLFYYEYRQDQYFATITQSMVFVEGGTFSMGGDGASDERPLHTVKLSSFYMSSHEVTQKEFLSLVNKNPSYIHDDSFPICRISWWDAIEYCNEKSKKHNLDTCYDMRTGKCNFSATGFRLPTEAEWEFAARGGNKSKKYQFSGSDTLDFVGWNMLNSKEDMQPVGQKRPNELGLYDMSGNVWEWCNDWYSNVYYASSPQVNPTGPTEGQTRSVRGGSWANYPYNSRVALRSDCKPENHIDDVGFRVVISAKK